MVKEFPNLLVFQEYQVCEYELPKSTCVKICQNIMIMIVLIFTLFCFLLQTTKNVFNVLKKRFETKLESPSVADLDLSHMI